MAVTCIGDGEMRLMPLFLFFLVVQFDLSNMTPASSSNGVMVDVRPAGSDWSSSDDYYVAEFSGGKNGRGLFPNIFNLATNAIVYANATCGQLGPENYCKLVEHVFMRSPQCDVCDNSNPLKRHPIEFAVDGTNRYWQSPTIASGLNYEWVTITLDLRQVLVAPSFALFPAPLYKVARYRGQQRCGGAT
ncbi:hypothetical protein D918_04790 [Trichuris suis]|nr:hypothetical protein D918_04790 [Trichuris suis]